MRQASHEIEVRTAGVGLYEVTAVIAGWVDTLALREGLLTVFIRHTSASLVIQENVDPDVGRDLIDFLARLAPRGGGYRHDAEGPDDMPAHLRSTVTQTHLSVPIRAGRLVLGTWQGIFVLEHRDRPHVRKLALHAFGA